MNFNKVFLAGNLTRDPELKFTPQGTAVCKLGIAVNRQYKGADGELKKECDFFNIVAWGKTGENCSKFLAKGRPVFVEGRLTPRSWEKDGVKHFAMDITADSVQFLGGRDDRSQPKPNAVDTGFNDESGRPVIEPGSFNDGDGVPF